MRADGLVVNFGSNKAFEDWAQTRAVDAMLAIRINDEMAGGKSFAPVGQLQPEVQASACGVHDGVWGGAQLLG